MSVGNKFSPPYVHNSFLKDGDSLILTDANVNFFNTLIDGLNIFLREALSNSNRQTLIPVLQAPPMSTATRNDFTAQNGNMIYNTDTNKFQGFAGGVWVDFH